MTGCELMVAHAFQQVQDDVAGLPEMQPWVPSHGFLHIRAQSQVMLSLDFHILAGGQSRAGACVALRGVHD